LWQKGTDENGEKNCDLLYAVDLAWEPSFKTPRGEPKLCGEKKKSNWQFGKKKILERRKLVLVRGQGGKNWTENKGANNPGRATEKPSKKYVQGMFHNLKEAPGRAAQRNIAPKKKTSVEGVQREKKAEKGEQKREG